MGRIAEPLVAMGARVAFESGDGLPMTIDGGPLQTVQWDNATGSAQVKSAVLLAGLVAGVPVAVRSARASRDHTERFLVALGATVSVEGDGVSLTPARRLRSFNLDVPGDPSSAAYLAALAALAGAGSLRLPGVLASPLRGGFFEVLGAIGAVVAADATPPTGIDEATVTFTVSPGTLRGVTIGPEAIPSMIDELPLLACVAACASGETHIAGAGELRVKESDRITATVANLRALGVSAEELPDGMRIVGRPDGAFRGRVITHGDHRIAMAFGVLGAATGNGIEIDDPGCVAVSYPRF
jgi:3-phosphoshikimate 1-carboxyvinyltransferase